MQFTATADKLIPDLAPRDELVLLARTLWREATTTISLATSPSAWVTGRCCAIRGC